MDKALQAASEYKASLSQSKGPGFASGQPVDTKAAVEGFSTFMNENGKALPFSTILDIAEMLIGILVKDPAMLATIKSVIAIIRRFLPAPTP